MAIALIARDNPDSLQKRMDTRPAHVEFLKSTEALLHAGPLLDDDEKPCGSLVIVDMTLQEAEAWAAKDPYAKVGLFASVELVRWNKVIG